MTALLDLDANVALSHALAQVEQGVADIAEIPMDRVMAVGLGEPRRGDHLPVLVARAPLVAHAV